MKSVFIFLDTQSRDDAAEWLLPFRPDFYPGMLMPVLSHS